MPTEARATRVVAWRQLPQGETRARRVAHLTDPPPPDPQRAFADEVAAAIAGPVLRYSQRVALIKSATRQGIGRFQANLIIASVLHDRGMGQSYEVPPERTKSGWRATVATVLTLQTAIVLSAWWLLR